MAWYYCLNNQRFGPVDEDAVKNLLAAGTVTRNTLVWRDGMDSWRHESMPSRQTSVLRVTVPAASRFLTASSSTGPNRWLFKQ